MISVDNWDILFIISNKFHKSLKNHGSNGSNETSTGPEAEQISFSRKEKKIQFRFKVPNSSVSLMIGNQLSCSLMVMMMTGMLLIGTTPVQKIIIPFLFFGLHSILIFLIFLI